MPIYFSMQSSVFLQSTCLKKIGCSFLTFQPFSIRKKLIKWMVVWRFAPTE